MHIPMVPDRRGTYFANTINSMDSCVWTPIRRVVVAVAVRPLPVSSQIAGSECRRVYNVILDLEIMFAHYFNSNF